MPRCEDYVNPNPYATPEPHFKPFYTGWLPGFGPRKRYIAPNTYEAATHDIMVPHPIAGRRLNNILEISNEDLRAKQEEDFYLSQHERYVLDLKRRGDTVSSYQGYIPRNVDNIGMTFTKAVRKATADFVKIRSNHDW
ncbi:hypothetical protein HNY73_008988 [Argiope bruennichi]|uniref:Uncharacterized protein n=1 Tax=Argiope bruennichi TaxID=94029 RepID=A0A8T0FAV3_ARGBR|nr:hypothetical protein HNY73_008988 [Argiope bruennichi]